jgi:Icc-related predicted phosphoesterase
MEVTHMIIIGLTDIHGDISKIEQIYDELSEADVVLIGGDITNFGREKEAMDVINAIRKNTSSILAISGNCDYRQVYDCIEKEGLNIHGKGTVINDIGFIGVGGSLFTPFNTPNEMSEDDFKLSLDKGLSELPSDTPVVLVSHQPPFQTACDILNTGMYVGSKSVRQFIEKNQPLLCFTGHIHEASAIDKIGDTQIINPGPFFNGNYTYVKISDKVDEVLIRSI